MLVTWVRLLDTQARAKRKQRSKAGARRIQSKSVAEVVPLLLKASAMQRLAKEDVNFWLPSFNDYWTLRHETERLQRYSARRVMLSEINRLNNGPQNLSGKRK